MFVRNFFMQKMSTSKKQSIFQKYASYLLGFVSGILNGLFGAGGGIAVVPMLEQMDIPPQKAHATSVAIILPLSIASTISYFIQGVPLNTQQLLWLIPFGLMGAILGTIILSKIKSDLLRRIFGAIIIYSGIRMLFL